MEPKSVLNSWKEVAQYVGRSTRTLQRWERDLGFPVHRPQGKTRSVIIAVPKEIDTWIENTPTAAVRSLGGEPGSRTASRKLHPESKLPKQAPWTQGEGKRGKRG